MAQTFSNFELLIIDATLAIMQRYTYDESVHILLQEHNQGQSLTRNEGLDLPQGYIALLDPDDLCYLERLER